MAKNFNVDKALAAGLTMDQINEHIAKRRAEGVDLFPVRKYSGGTPDEPGGMDVNPLLDPVEIPAMLLSGPTRAGVGAVARRVGGAASRTALPNLRSAASMVERAASHPIVEADWRARLARRVAGGFGRLGGDAPADDAAARSLARIRGGSGLPSIEAPPPRPQAKITPIGEAAKRKPVRPRGKKPSGKMTAAEQAAAREKGRAVAPTKSPQAMRGKSAPKLEREAKARARKPDLRELVDEGDDLEALLSQSLQAEAEMAAAGLDPAERALVRSVLRGQ